MMSKSQSNLFDKKRFESFFDAAFAIVLTILVLELKIPDLHHDDFSGVLLEMKSLFPTLLSYVISFFTIGAIWMDHHTLFRYIEKINRRFMMYNLLFLFFTSLLPFTTALAAENMNDAPAVSLYGFNFLLMNLSFGNLFSYPVRHKWMENAFQNTMPWTIASFIFIGISIPLAWVNPLLTILSLMIATLLHIIKPETRT